jgi:hypothetical protein
MEPVGILQLWRVGQRRLVLMIKFVKRGRGPTWVAYVGDRGEA